MLGDPIEAGDPASSLCIDAMHPMQGRQPITEKPLIERAVHEGGSPHHHQRRRPSGARRDQQHSARLAGEQAFELEHPSRLQGLVGITQRNPFGGREGDSQVQLPTDPAVGGHKPMHRARALRRGLQRSGRCAADLDHLIGARDKPGRVRECVRRRMDRNHRQRGRKRVHRTTFGLTDRLISVHSGCVSRRVITSCHEKRSWPK